MKYFYDQKNCQLWVDVTQLTCHLFWSDIEKVEISEYLDDDEADEKTKKEIADRIMKELKKDLKKGNGIEADQEHIRLTFKGGHQIEYWNSEWGGINVFKAHETDKNEKDVKNGGSRYE